jgi:hypothetical protein
MDGKDMSGVGPYILAALLILLVTIVVLTVTMWAAVRAIRRAGTWAARIRVLLIPIMLALAVSMAVVAIWGGRPAWLGRGIPAIVGIPALLGALLLARFGGDGPRERTVRVESDQVQPGDCYSIWRLAGGKLTNTEPVECLEVGDVRIRFRVEQSDEEIEVMTGDLVRIDRIR